MKDVGKLAKRWQKPSVIDKNKYIIQATTITDKRKGRRIEEMLNREPTQRWPLTYRDAKYVIPDRIKPKTILD